MIHISQFKPKNRAKYTPYYALSGGVVGSGGTVGPSWISPTLQHSARDINPALVGRE
jgi:hypothetical protein